MDHDPFELVARTIDNKYRVDEVVGEGGFGVVYRGFHLSFEHPIAVKCLKVPTHFTSDAQRLFFEKFREEGKLLSKLSSAHLAIVRVYDFGLTPHPRGVGPKIPYLVLEWLHGRSLEQVLEARAAAGLGPLSELEAVRLLRPGIEAIAVAHALGIAHRDVKPANLFVSEVAVAGQPSMKVLDFGIAKAMQEGESATELATRTSSGFSAFSPPYAAPEQFRPKKFGSSGPWSDVHALGLVLVELVTGRPALDGEEHGDFFESSTSDTRPTPRRRGAVVSDAFEAVCERALALMPSARFASAGELLQALDACVAPAPRPVAAELVAAPPPLAAVVAPAPVAEEEIVAVPPTERRGPSLASNATVAEMPLLPPTTGVTPRVAAGAGDRTLTPVGTGPSLVRGRAPMPEGKGEAHPSPWVVRGALGVALALAAVGVGIGISRSTHTDEVTATGASASGATSSAPIVPPAPAVLDDGPIPITSAEIVAGPKDALVTVALYGDLVSGRSATAVPGIRKWLAEHPEAKVRLVWKHFVRSGGPAGLAARQLLVAYKGAADAPKGVERSKEEARARATEALVQLQNRPFDEVVLTYSDDPDAKQTLGDLGEVEPGTLSPAAVSALDAVAVGRETGVVETPEGFRILRRMPSGVARGAALAAEAVLRIGGPAKLFALLDKIRDQVDVDARLLERWVRDIGVDATAYAAALADPAVAAKVDGDVARATDLGVVAPGTLFVNGTSAGAARVGERIEGELALASALVTVGEPAGEVSARVTRRRFTASPLVYRVSTEGAPSRGPSDAPVTIVEYGDFQCPYTARAEATLERLRSRYGSSLRFVWRDMPLPFHPRAEPAASLAREARAQKRDPGFWTVHDRLFADARSARSARLEDADLLEVARATGLDTAAVTSALAQKKHRAAVEAEAAAAVGEAGVTGTPQFFVNGRRIVGGVPFEHFRQTIEEELAKAKKLLARGVAPAAVYDELTKDGFVGAERVDVGPPPTDRPFKGGASAKVTLQVFSDFQCPYCRLAEEQALAEVARTYGERVKIVWRHSPLWFHKDAVPAAEAAEEAFAQKGNAGFWAFHDALFAGTGPDALGRATLERYAAELGLDLARFRRALDDHTHRGKLAADAVAAFRAEVGGVPSFTVGAFPIEGAQPFEAFKKLIDAELAAAPR